MVDGRTSRAAYQIARVFQDGTFLGMSDRQVLERFVAERDASAFEVLVARHGPMVRRVCRQFLCDPHDADDAFQAVFLALIRKARSIRVEQSLGPWLYRVANRVAARARSQRSRIAAREPSGRGLPEGARQDDQDGFELHRVVHEELDRLPERLRAPVVLCYLEGMTHDLAACQLNWPVGTVRSRLARARGVLERRLSRRGLAVTAVALGSLLESATKAASGAAPVPVSLIGAVTRSARQALPGGGPITCGSITALGKGVMIVFPFKKVAVAATAVLSVGAVVFVLSARSNVSGQTGRARPPASAVEADQRPLGPDGRPIGARPVKSKTETITKTYYVGDLLARNQVVTSVEVEESSVPAGHPSGRAGNRGEGFKTDYTPLVNLIQQTVAPGTWTEGLDPSVPNVVSHFPPERGGSIATFNLSRSLIIRCKPEVHQQVAQLIRGLREVVLSRDKAGAQGGAESHTELTPTRPTVPPAPAASSPGNSNTRIERLLDELREEVKKLDR